MLRNRKSYGKGKRRQPDSDRSNETPELIWRICERKGRRITHTALTYFRLPNADPTVRQRDVRTTFCSCRTVINTRVTGLNYARPSKQPERSGEKDFDPRFSRLHRVIPDNFLNVAQLSVLSHLGIFERKSGVICVFRGTNDDKRTGNVFWAMWEVVKKFKNKKYIGIFLCIKEKILSNY